MKLLSLKNNLCVDQINKIGMTNFIYSSLCIIINERLHNICHVYFVRKEDREADFVGARASLAKTSETA